MTRIVIALLLLPLVAAPFGCQTQQAQHTAVTLQSHVSRDIIAWSDAVRMIQTGQIKMVVQYHTLDAILTTVEGKQFRTKQPKIDAAKYLLGKVDPTGKKVVYGTE